MNGQVSSKEILQHYEHMRETTSNLCKRAMDNSDKKNFVDAGKVLGLWHNGTFIFNNESEMAVLLDYYMLHHYEKGTNQLYRFFAAKKSELSNSEAQALDAMLDAKFRIFVVKQPLSDGGVIVTDIISQEDLLLIDKCLSKMAQSLLEDGNILMFGATLIEFQYYVMTSGSPILMTKELASELTPYLTTFAEKHQRFGSVSSEIQSRFVKQFLKIALRTDALSHCRYE